MMDHEPIDPLEARADALFRELSEESLFDQVEPLPPSEVRRLGNRRRTRRRAGVAAAALGVSLVAGSAFLQFRGDGPATTPRTIDAAATANPSPTTSTSIPVATSLPSESLAQPTASESAQADASTAESSSSDPGATTSTPVTSATPASGTAIGDMTIPAAATTANLPGSSLIYWNTPGDMEQQGSDAVGAEALDKHISACDGSIDYGQRNTLIRSYSTADATVSGSAAVFDFATETEASNARQKYRGNFETCATRNPGGPDVKTSVSKAYELPVSGANIGTLPTNASYRSILFDPVADNMALSWNDVTVITVGNRMIVVSYYVNSGAEHRCTFESGTGDQQCASTKEAGAIANLLAKR